MLALETKVSHFYLQTDFRLIPHILCHLLFYGYCISLHLPGWYFFRHLQSCNSPPRPLPYLPTAAPGRPLAGWSFLRPGQSRCPVSGSCKPPGALRRDPGTTALPFQTGWHPWLEASSRSAGRRPYPSAWSRRLPPRPRFWKKFEIILLHNIRKNPRNHYSFGDFHFELV